MKELNALLPAEQAESIFNQADSVEQLLRLLQQASVQDVAQERLPDGRLLEQVQPPSAEQSSQPALLEDAAFDGEEVD